jgi:protein O-mannosyl-transferase
MNSGLDASNQSQSLRLAAPPSRPQWPPLFNLVIALLVIAVALLAVYAPSLQYHFILDDHRFTNDPRVQTEGHVWEYFSNYVWAQFTGGPTSFYRPVFILWMRLNFILNEMSPWGWHLLSILKHLVVALLLYFLVWKLLRDATAALLAALLFALHPAQTESVAWVTVPDPLVGIGILSALLFYQKYVENLAPAPQRAKATKKGQKAAPAKAPSRPALPWLIASAAACFLAMLAKETAVILPVILFILVFLMLRNAIQPGAENVEPSPTGPLPLLLAALRLTWPFAIATALYFLLRFHALSGKFGSLTQHLPWQSVVLSWPSVLWFYTKVMLWPVRSYAYGDPTIVEHFSVQGVLLPGLAVACILAVLALAIFRLWKEARRALSPAEACGVEYALLIGVLLLVLPILLVLNLNGLNPGDFLHGRYVYLSLIGLMLILAVALRLAGKARNSLLWVAGALAIVFAGLTLSQEGQWKDDLTLFTLAHQLALNNPWVALNRERANVQAALPLVEQGRCADALPVFERVTQEYPQEWSAWSGLGYCYFTQNNLPKAEESLHRAAQLSRDPRTIEMWQELRSHMNLPTVPLD